MKLAGMIAAAALTAGAAHAQTADCNQMMMLFTAAQPAIVELRGAPASGGIPSETTFVSRTNVKGFNDCTIGTAKEGTNTLSNGYTEHHLSCRGKFADNATAVKYVEDLYACVKDVVGEREIREQRLNGAYRMSQIDARYITGGRDTEFTFNKTGYVRLWVERAYLTSDQVNLNMYFYFPKS